MIILGILILEKDISPICNPGKEAILAAANPYISDYLYLSVMEKEDTNLVKLKNTILM